MIRSNIDFAAPLLANLSSFSLKPLESIQYHSMVKIVCANSRESHTDMRKRLQIDKISDRCLALKDAYLNQALSENPLIQGLFDEYLQNLETLELNEVESLFHSSET